MAITYVAPDEQSPATLVIRLVYQIPNLEVLEVLPPAEDNGKTVDYELRDDTLAIVVFGGTDPVPTGTLAFLKMQVSPEAEVGSINFVLNSGSHGADTNAAEVAVQVVSGNVRVIETPDKHKADTEPDWSISLEELLRVIQLYNAGEYHCDVAGEDEYAAGTGVQDCTPHDADYAPADWRISFSELLRLIQLYNAPFQMYHTDATSEDGFAPGPFGYVP